MCLRLIIFPTEKSEGAGAGGGRGFLRNLLSVQISYPAVSTRHSPLKNSSNADSVAVEKESEFEGSLLTLPDGLRVLRNGLGSGYFHRLGNCGGKFNLVT